METREEPAKKLPLPKASPSTYNHYQLQHDLNIKLEAKVYWNQTKNVVKQMEEKAKKMTLDPEELEQ